MKDISVLEMMGLNPRPIGTIVVALWVLLVVLGTRLNGEGFAKGFKHPSFQQGRNILSWIVLAMFGLLFLAMPLFPATR